MAKLRPRDPDAQKKLRTCETEVQKIRFQAAISSEAAEGPPVSESVDPTSYRKHPLLPTDRERERGSSLFCAPPTQRA